MAEETQNVETQTEEKVENQTEEATVQAEEESKEQTEQAEKSAEDKIAELEKENADLKDQLLRRAADFDNYRKRTLKEKSELLKSAGESVLLNILPLVDDFERAQKALENVSDVESMKEGINLIYEKFISFLAQNGVKAIETEGKEFDLDFHEAITTIPAPSEDLKGKVIDCTQKGYVMNDKVIRFAKVVVGQ